jgi:adenylyl- and sulfurtransferase ThiI
MKNAPKFIICHYDEIGLKGGNRRFFEEQLRKNIESVFRQKAPEEFEYVKRISGRIIVRLAEKAKVKKLTALLGKALPISLLRLNQSKNLTQSKTQAWSF